MSYHAKKEPPYCQIFYSSCPVFFSETERKSCMARARQRLRLNHWARSYYCTALSLSNVLRNLSRQSLLVFGRRSSSSSCCVMSWRLSGLSLSVPFLNFLFLFFFLHYEWLCFFISLQVVLWYCAVGNCNLRYVIKELFSPLQGKSMIISMKFITSIVIGGTPYPSIGTPDQLKDSLSSGKRMSRPENCCEEL